MTRVIIRVSMAMIANGEIDVLGGITLLYQESSGNFGYGCVVLLSCLFVD